MPMALSCTWSPGALLKMFDRFAVCFGEEWVAMSSASDLSDLIMSDPNLHMYVFSALLLLCPLIFLSDSPSLSLIIRTFFFPISPVTVHGIFVTKLHDSFSKKARTSFTDGDKLMMAAEYAKMGYLASIGAKGNFKLDEDAEKEGRTTIDEEPVSWDLERNAFTTAQAWRDMNDAENVMYQNVGRDEVNRLEEVLEYYLRAQTWLAGGAATGSPRSPTSDKNDIE